MKINLTAEGKAEELKQRVRMSEGRARACGGASVNFFGERLRNKLIYNIPLRSTASPILFMGAYHHTGSSAQHHSAMRDVDLSQHAAVLLQLSRGH